MSPPSPQQRLLDALLATLPPERVEVQGLCVGSFLTAVVSRCCGLASSGCSPWDGQLQAPVGRAGGLLPASVADLVPLLRSSSTVEASIGLAALNSVQAPDTGRAHCLELNGYELIRRRAAASRVAVVGHFPFVERLRPLARELWCFELPGRQHPGDLGPAEMDRLLPQADVVAVSATAILNHTLGDILARCRPEAFRLLLGPSTPLAPVLLEHGLDAIAGTQVVDTQAALAAVSQGGSFKQIPGVRLVTLLRKDEP